MRWRFALALARREARASRRRMLLYGACMALGIASLVGLHGLRATVRTAVDAQAQRILGADLRLASRAPFEDASLARVRDLVNRSGREAARITRFGSMALAPRSSRTRLVDVQAVEGGYPLYGSVVTDPPGVWSELPGEAPIALVDSSLLVQLDTGVGDELVLGDVRFRIAGAVLRAPGAFGVMTQVAPRVFVSGRHLDATGLAGEGSLMDHMLFLAAPAAQLEPWIERHRSALQSERVRLRTVRGQQEELDRSTATLTRYLGLVGLGALALGAVGVAAGVRVFVGEKLDSAAVLRSLGARSADVLLAYGLLALALGAVSGLLGSTLGVGVQWLLPRVMAELLPLRVEPRLELGAVVTGIVLGLWVTLVFSVGPLLELRSVPPLRALRRDFTASTRPTGVRVGMVLVLGATLLAGSLWQAPQLEIGLGFAAGLAVALGVLALAARGAMRGLRRARPAGAPFWLRQGISNLFRPRNHTLASVLALGFGVFLVATLHTVQHNVRRQMALDSSPDRPNLVFFDVQVDQVAPLEAFLGARNAPILERAPLVSARIAKLGAQDAAQLLAGEELERGFRWALRREYRLTYADELRESETVVAGEWWLPGANGGTAEVSLESDLAEDLGVGVGDVITWDVQGVPLPSVVTSLRDVDWGRRATNFFAILPPSALGDAPQTQVLLSRLDDPADRAALQRDLVVEFPNISALDATVILDALDALHREMTLAVRVLAGFTLVTGLAVLLAAAAAGRRERSREAELLRTLGARSRTVRNIVTTEAAALAAISVAVGMALAGVCAWAVVRFAFELPFDPPLPQLAGLALATLVVSTGIGVGAGALRAGAR